MLTFAEISQLSDRDLADEIASNRDALFRQKMGVKTGHLKDSHIVEALKKYIARLLTESNRRKKFGESVEKTDATVAKKAEESRKEIEKAQAGKTEKKSEPKKKAVAEKEVEDEKVKVKKTEKKGLFGGKKKAEEK